MTEDEARDQSWWDAMLTTAINRMELILEEWGKEDAAIRAICEPVIGQDKAYGTVKGVPSILEVVKATIKKLREGKSPTRHYFDCPRCGSAKCHQLSGVGFEHVRKCNQCGTNWENEEEWEWIHKTTTKP